MLIDSLQTRVLVELLLKMFTPDELLRFLASLPGAGDIAHHIPSRHVEPYWMFYACVSALARRRLLEGDEFYTALEKDRSKWAEDIARARRVLQPNSQQPAPDEAEQARAREQIKAATAQMTAPSATERLDGWRALADALATLQQGRSLSGAYREELDRALHTLRQGTDKLAHLFWGQATPPDILDKMSAEELRALVAKEQHTSHVLRTLKGLASNLAIWFLLGKKLKDAAIAWHIAYSQQRSIPVPESVDILVSGITRWTRLQFLQLAGAGIGAGLFLYQLVLLNTEIQNQQLQLQNQEVQIKTEQFESQEFRRTTLYRTLYSSEPCPTAPSQRCPTFDRRSRQEAALALLRIRDSNAGEEALDWAGALLSEVQLEGVSLQSIALDKADLTRAYLFKADLRGTSCTQTRFHGATLQEAKLQGASLYRADLSHAHLEDAKLQGVTAREASLREATLTGADLTGANLNDAILTGARYSAETRWPEGFDPSEHGLVLVSSPEE